VLLQLVVISASQQDHPGVPLMYKVPGADSLHNLERSPLQALWEALRYLFTGDSMLSSPISQMAVFALSKLLDEDSRTFSASYEGGDSYSPSNIPDIEIAAVPYNIYDDSRLEKDEGFMTLVCLLLKPRSAGTVRLASLDAHERPICDLEFLREKEDYEVFRKALRLGLALGRKCREHGYTFQDMILPDSESEEDLDNYIRRRVRSSFHYTSTCKMAPEQERGVVDDELKVHGIPNLRIADASIFPAAPAAHPQAPVVMVAERCADFMKAARQVAV
jgi:choline dehydrogenase